MVAENSNGSRVLSAVRKLLPEIAARAEETEQNRGLAPELIARLSAAGLFRMLVPKKHGGEELTQRQAAKVIEELAWADGSAGWTAMVVYGFNIAFSRFPRPFLETLFASGPNPKARGTVAPMGRAVKEGDGYVVNGQWALASGSFEPDWVAAGCLVFERGKPKIGPSGRPEIILAMLRGNQVEFLDTWYSTGLRGSGSHDFVAKDQLVPKVQTTDILSPATPITYDAPFFHAPFFMLTGATHVAVALGITRGALEDITQLGRAKRLPFNPAMTLSEDPVFAHRLGELWVRLDALRALADRQLNDNVPLRNVDHRATAFNIARDAARVAHVHVECVDIVNEAFALGGSTPVYSRSVLQRRWRDIRCAAQHISASASAYRNLGSALSADQ